MSIYDLRLVVSCYGKEKEFELIRITFPKKSPYIRYTHFKTVWEIVNEINKEFNTEFKTMLEVRDNMRIVNFTPEELNETFELMGIMSADIEMCDFVDHMYEADYSITKILDILKNKKYIAIKGSLPSEEADEYLKEFHNINLSDLPGIIMDNLNIKKMLSQIPEEHFHTIDTLYIIKEN